MKSESEIAKQFAKHKSASKSRLGNQYDNTRRCQAFYAGDSMSYQDNMQFVTRGGQKKRAMVQFNQVKPYVNSVKGFIAQNRRKAKYVARMEGQMQELYTQYANAMAGYIRDNANADQVETQQDGDMLICGYGATETALTYGDGYASTDPNGEILKGRLDPMAVGFDPYARQTNLLDSRWVYYEKEYELEEALKLFDDSKEGDFEEIGDSPRDQEGWVYYEGGGNVDRIRDATYEWADEDLQIVRVYFYQWYDVESFYRAENPIYKLTNPLAIEQGMLQMEALAAEAEASEYGDMFSFDPRAEIITFDANIKKKLVDLFGKYIEVYEFKRKVFYSAVVSGDHVFSSYRNPSQQGFTIKFKTGDYDNQKKMWTGMVNSMMEPQLYYNKALTELMFIIGSNSKGGVMVERTAVEDITDFEDKYARTDGVIIVEDGALAGGKIQPKKEPFQPTGYEDVVRLTADALVTVSGIDKSFLGSSENKQETAQLQRQRIRQITSSLACYVDSVTLYQKEDARMLLDLMLVYAENNAGSLFRILGEDGAEEFVRISSDKFAAEYDVVIQEAPQTADEKTEYAELLSTMADKLISVGDPTGKVLYAIALKYLPLDKADVQQITEVLMPKDDTIDPAYVKQLEQTIQSLMSETSQADVRQKLSNAALNLAKVDQVKADISKKGAETTKVLEEAERTSVETLAARKADKSGVTISI